MLSEHVRAELTITLANFLADEMSSAAVAEIMISGFVGLERLTDSELLELAERKLGHLVDKP